ncbi:MAG: thioredoxin-disulfide reductase [Candidatus Doudnabacteria bacterium]|jgi:thioredoxin reductase (NADPH)
MNDSKVYNVIIIGSGPAGLTAAIYAGRAELKPLVLAGLKPGGQLMDTTEVENFPGFVNGVMGPELMGNMTKQAERFETTILPENVESVDFSASPFKIKTGKGEYLAKSVIIATGAEANWLGLPGEQRLRGKGVSACATCDGFFFKGKDVAVIGGGDSAMEEANFLTRFANKVYIVHRRAEFKASKIMLKRAQDNPKISFVTNVAVLDVVGESTVEGLKIKDNATGAESTLPLQGVFLAIGHTPAAKIFASAGVEIDQKGYIKVQNNTHTNIPGVFVAGDVNDPRYRQAISAAGMGCMAALDVEKYLAEVD